MESIITIKDNLLGTVYIVIPKIREIAKGLGSVTITYDNGDKRNIESNNPDELMSEIAEQVENYYKC